MSDEAPPSAKAPTLFRNYISFAGALIVAASLVSIVLLFLIELTKTAENPYLGIVTYVILPSFLILGIVVVIEAPACAKFEVMQNISLSINIANIPYTRRMHIGIID